MITCRTLTIIALFLVSVSLVSLSQNKKEWVTAYYPLWAAPSMYPEKLDYKGITHIVHFSANPAKTAPYLDVLIPAKAGSFNQDSVNIQWGGVYNGNNPPLWRTVDIQQMLISKSHSAGVKVILSVGGIYGTGAETMSWISKDPGRISTFVSAASSYARRKGYDGIEVDWEFPKAEDRAGFNSMIRQFRNHLDKWKPRGELLAAVHESPGPYFAYERDVMVECFDQINPMTYEMYAGNFRNVRTGYTAPMNVSAEFPDYNGYAIDQPGHGPKSWIQEGYPASKIGLSISFLTTEFYSVTTPIQPGQTFKRKNWGYYKNIPSEGRHWDKSASVPWQASGSTFISYEDPTSIRIKIEYMRSLNLGGIMIYDLLGGFVPDAKPGENHFLLRSAVEQMRNSSP